MYLSPCKSKTQSFGSILEQMVLIHIGMCFIQCMEFTGNFNKIMSRDLDFIQAYKNIWFVTVFSNR